MTKQNRSLTLRRLNQALCLCAAAVFVFVQISSTAVSALKTADYNAIHQWPLWNPNLSACGAGSASVPVGNLPTIIPEPYNGAFTQGGHNHNVAPALVAAIFTEENFTGSPTTQLPSLWGNFPKVHPNPDSGWPVSPAGAEGPFQFLPSTWTGLGYNIADINKLVTAADAAADYLARNGATTNKPPSSWQNAIFAYNHAQWYVNAVMGYYNYYNTGNSSTSGTSQTSGNNCSNGTTSATGCVAPLSKASGVISERVDMGVDFYMADGSAIVAMCDGKVQAATSSGSGWPGGGCVFVLLTAGPYSGKNYYVCENITPTVKAGDTVTAGQQIAKFYSSYYGIEMGWGEVPYGALAAKLGQQCGGTDPGCWSSASGVSFNNFIVAAGGKHGVCVPGAPHQSMPSGYPPVNSSQPPCSSFK